jgi:hypothetical protein
MADICNAVPGCNGRKAPEHPRPRFGYPQFYISRNHFNVMIFLQACAALSLSSQLMSVAAALESDLEPFTKLKQFELFSNAVVSCLV